MAGLTTTELASRQFQCTLLSSNQHAIGDPLAPFVAGGIDRLSFFGSADSALILSRWLFAFFYTRSATKMCCTWLKQRLGVGEALLTQSCTSALEMAALLCNLAPGDEVIMPSFTFVSTANAVVLRGATPVFVEIRRDTLNINEGAVESAITPRTKAIFVVHYSGVPCEMNAINTIARRHGFLVVEDADQALL